jgi:hypothetical protein
MDGRMHVPAISVEGWSRKNMILPRLFLLKQRHGLQAFSTRKKLTCPAYKLPE